MNLISYRCAACRLRWVEEEHDDPHFSGACPRCGMGGIPVARTSDVQDIGPGDADGELELDDGLSRTEHEVLELLVRSDEWLTVEEIERETGLLDLEDAVLVLNRRGFVVADRSTWTITRSGMDELE